MNKENLFNLIDFGSSKLISVFDYNLNEKFSESEMFLQIVIITSF